jgi:hypothetical protein
VPALLNRAGDVERAADRLDVDGGGLLHLPVGVVDRLGQPVVADREVDQRPLRLRAPVLVGRDLDGAHRVGLGPGAGGQADRGGEDARA